MENSLADYKLLPSVLKQCGAEIMKLWPGGEGNVSALQIKKKADGSRVTNADLRSNEILVRYLREHFPEDAIVSEEGPQDDQEEGQGGVWFLDPLDGTHSFIDGNDDFSVLLGRAESGQPELGFMYFPALDLSIVGDRNRGAWENEEPLKVSSRQLCREEGVYLHRFKGPESPLIFPGEMDSGFALGELCRGNLEGVIIRLRTHKEWDLAAPAAAILGAGGQVSDGQGNPFPFSYTTELPRYFVASNGACHQEVLTLIE